MFLLQSHDVEVQRAASAALGNLAVNGRSHSYVIPLWNVYLYLSTIRRQQDSHRTARRAGTSDPPNAVYERRSAMQRSRMYHKFGYTR